MMFLRTEGQVCVGRIQSWMTAPNWSALRGVELELVGVQVQEIDGADDDPRECLTHWSLKELESGYAQICTFLALNTFCTLQ